MRALMNAAVAAAASKDTACGHLRKDTNEGSPRRLDFSGQTQI